MQIYSNTFNFDSYLSGGIDPRTGQYSSSVQLATIAAEGPVEARRDITLSFSIMEARDNGYGLGWTLPVTSFDGQRRPLTLMSGQRYRTDPLPALGLVLGSAHTAQTYATSSGDAATSPFEPVEGALYGTLESVAAMSEEFDEQASRLRASAIYDL